MTTSAMIIIGIAGFVQGFVALATTVTLSKSLANLVLSAARKPYDPLRTGPDSPVATGIARAVSFIALVILNIAVMEVVLVALSQRDPEIRFNLGRIALFTLIAGLVVSRLLPEFEAWVRSRKR